MRLAGFKRMFVVAVAVTALGLVGCDDEEGGGGEDMGTDMMADMGGDTGVGDTGVADTGVADTGGDDTGGGDTTGGDTTMGDTTGGDTAGDTTMGDTTGGDMVDMADMGCTPEPEVSWEACNDGVDNDCDDATDTDEGCSVCPPSDDSAHAEEETGLCDDGLDNDCDGFMDCVDFDCIDDAACPDETTDALCMDGEDNDGDGRIDCLGRDCTPTDGSVTVCQPASGDETTAEDDMTLCSDQLDNDLDGFTDCDDDECDGIGYCGSEDSAQTCTDGNDNDGDGRVDCADSGCADAPPCSGEGDDTTCVDGMDNDNDGRIDCADSDCYADPAVTVCTAADEICDDSMDNDDDGLVDCFDPNCLSTCETEACSADNPVGTCTDANDVCTDAGECGTPLSEFDLTSEMPILIVEFHADPAVTSSDGEYIELLNVTDGRIVLDGAMLNDEVNTYDLPDGLSIGAGELFLMTAEEDSMVNGGLTPDATFPWGLNNGGDTITLEYMGDTVHEVVYPGTGGPDINNTGIDAGDGQSTQLDKAYIDSVIAGSPGTVAWCLTPMDAPNNPYHSDANNSDYGTPGADNVNCP